VNATTPVVEERTTANVAAVGCWTGVAIRALHMARRMSVREFAAHLGVSERVVSKWERETSLGRGRPIRPQPVSQSALDVSLARCNMQEMRRFWALFSRDFCPTCGVGRAVVGKVEIPAPAADGPEDPEDSEKPKPVVKAPPVTRVHPDPLGAADFWADPAIATSLITRDIRAIYRYLQNRGISQRDIAYRTGQQQSEISEVLAGRSIGRYDLLVRIADGLRIPRGRLGLAYDPDLADFPEHVTFGVNQTTEPLAEERAT
jgi:transcriptional regulator with XRE-family HTH domain